MHPFHQHGEHRAGRERVKHILKSGGAAHPDAVADKKLFSDVMGRSERGESRVEGGKGKCFARGGRAKHKGSQTNIAIVVPQKGGSPAAEGPQGPVMPPVAGPTPPMMPPGGPGGPPPMRASGGRVKGKLPSAGAESGVGRLQKAHK